MKLFSPAKINLLLNVLRKRKDGYHELQTVFERIDLGDMIELTPKKYGISLACTGDSMSRPYLRVPNGPKNLAWRAAALLQERLRTKKGVHIRIQKRIPVSAGLGGGSSNAASVLLGLNRLWKLRLTQERLLKLGAAIGSDVPFFILETSFGCGSALRSRPFPSLKRRILPK